MAESVSAAKYLHAGGQVVGPFDSRFAALLVSRADLDSLRVRVRGVDAEFDAQLMALVIAGRSWTAEVNGSKSRKSAEVVETSSVMKVRQVAEALGVTGSWVRQELRSGRLKGIRPRNVWLIDRTDFEHYRATRP